MVNNLNKPTISVVILTKNEELNIRRCLDSLKDWVDEIIIIDDESVDQTVAIAQNEYAAKVIIQPSNNCLAKQRNTGIATASQEWVLQMDADEVFLPQTAKAIIAALHKPGINVGFYVLRRDCVWKVPLNYVGNSYQLKIFKKMVGNYSGMIHEKLEVKGAIGKINSPVLHYSMPSIFVMLQRHNFYTEVESVKYLQDNPSINVVKFKKELRLKPFKLFYKHYVKNRGFKDGIHGLVYSLIHTMYPVILWLKVLELLESKKK